MYLYFYNYNNYYNRKVLKEYTINGYNLASTSSYAFPNPVSFNPGDGVDTKFRVTGMNNFHYDYLVCSDGSSVVSRWFIIEASRDRDGTYNLDLHRDVIAEELEYIKTAPMFIEKATLDDYDPMIFNKENMTFNQIKYNQEYIKDASGCPWIVGYMPASFDEAKTINLPTRNSYDLSVNGIANWQYYKYTSINPDRTTAVTDVGLKMEWWTQFTSDSPVISTCMAYKPADDLYQPVQNVQKYDPTRFFVKTRGMSQNEVATLYANVMRNNYSALVNIVTDGYITGYYSPTDWTTLGTYNNKVIYDTVSRKYYRISVISEDYSSTQLIKNGSLHSEWIARMRTIPNRVGDVSDQMWFKLVIQGNQRRLVLNEVQLEVPSVTLQGTRYYLDDSPYYMFCIPYSDTLTVSAGGQLKYTANKDMAYTMYSQLVQELQVGTDHSTGNLYDIQLLPYCPVPEFLTNDGNINIPTTQETSAISYALNEGTPVGGVIWCRNSKGSIVINKSITVSELKVESQTNFCRICSPDYSSVYEFIPARNRGVSQFNIDYQYKPYSPYIHINPVFNSINGLYGLHNYEGFNDPTGLICSGNFSLPYTTDAMEQYELQNRNYLNIFNRQIENLEVKQSVERIQDIVGGASGALAGAAGGALFGPVGAIVGGVASAAAGAADYALNERLRNENMDYTKDLFGYQMGNVEALPNTLGRITSFTPNNPVFPYIEFYTCSEMEKQALRDKLTYNGMSVGRIGTLEEFIRSTPTYIKGQLIRVEGIEEDFHYIKSICDELNKGVFI